MRLEYPAPRPCVETVVNFVVGHAGGDAGERG